MKDSDPTLALRLAMFQCFNDNMATTQLVKMYGSELVLSFVRRFVSARFYASLGYLTAAERRKRWA